jgi:Sec-independent protein secretion pathway component TatC
MLTAPNLREHRRTAVVAITAAAAIFSAPDPISMLDLMLPTWALYEIAILVLDNIDRS